MVWEVGLLAASLVHILGGRGRGKERTQASGPVRVKSTFPVGLPTSALTPERRCFCWEPEQMSMKVREVVWCRDPKLR